MKNRLATGDTVKVIDRGSAHLNKTGKVEEIGFIPVVMLLEGTSRKETYIRIKLDDNTTITVSDIEKNLRKQIEKLA